MGGDRPLLKCEKFFSRNYSRGASRTLRPATEELTHAPVKCEAEPGSGLCPVPAPNQIYIHLLMKHRPSSTTAEIPEVNGS